MLTSREDLFGCDTLVATATGTAEEWQEALLREAADHRKDSCDHKSMWVNRNVTRLLTELAALERTLGLDRR